MLRLRRVPYRFWIRPRPGWLRRDPRFGGWLQHNRLRYRTRRDGLRRGLGTTGSGVGLGPTGSGAGCGTTGSGSDCGTTGSDVGLGSTGSVSGAGPTGAGSDGSGSAQPAPAPARPTEQRAKTALLDARQHSAPATELESLPQIRPDIQGAQNLREQHCEPPREAQTAPPAPNLRQSSPSAISELAPIRRALDPAGARHGAVIPGSSSPPRPLRREHTATAASRPSLSQAQATSPERPCHSGSVDRPHPRERSPPNPVSASSRNALVTRRLPAFLRVVVREHHHRPQSGVARELEAGGHVGSTAAGIQPVHCGADRNPMRNGPSPGRDQALALAVDDPAILVDAAFPRPATAPPRRARSARSCSESSWRAAAATCCAAAPRTAVALERKQGAEAHRGLASSAPRGGVQPFVESLRAAAWRS